MREPVLTGALQQIVQFGRWVHAQMQHVAQRLTALFLCLLILSGVAIPPVLVYAAQNEADAIKPATTGSPHKSTPPDTTTEMKQNYAGPLSATKVGFTPAETTLATATNFDKPGTAHRLTVDESIKKQNEPIDRSKQQEIAEKRDANKEVFRNNNGSLTERHYMEPKFYKTGGQWKTIDASLVEDKDAADSGNIFGKLYGQVQSAIDSEQAFTVKENDWQARFSPSDFDGGMVRVKKGNDQVGFSPAGAKRVAPVVTKDGHGKQTVHYYDLWPGVNVEYIVTSGKLKENIVIKDKQSATSFSFKVTGARLAANDKLPGSFKLQGALDDRFGVSPINLILNKYGFVDQDVFKQEHKDDLLQISVDKTYLQSLPADAFPATIDPSIDPSIGGAGSSYTDFKSTGAVCYSGTCSMYAGSLNDGTGWRQWRTAFHVPYDFLTPSTDLLGASVNLFQDNGTVGVRSFQTYNATCSNNFNCVDWGLAGSAVSFDTYGGMDVTPIYQALKSANIYGGWLMLLGQECGCQSEKEFDPGSYVQFDYNNHPSIPAPEVPADGATIVTTQPILGVGTSTDPDGDPVSYAYQLRSTNGVIIYQSDWADQNRLTVPEGLLQDGGSYVWSYILGDGYSNTGWQNGGTFRVDLRTGKDKTSTYDDIGPVSVSMNNGNAYTSASSHSITALAGTIGVDLSYNSPYASKMGLRAAYYNNQTQSGDPVLRRTEASIDFNWGTGSPAQNVVPNDHVSAQYDGYFIAPTTGTYYFGGTNDDYMGITVDGQSAYASGGCYSSPCYGSGISLTAGQTVTFRTNYEEATGPAFAHVYVKGAVAETIIKTEWLRTAPMPTEQSSGLTGHYYRDNGSHDPAQLTNQFMVRQDPAVNFQWGTNAPVPGTDADNFYVRWEGYFVPPAGGSYYFGARADDGFRIKVNGTTVVDNWVGGSYPATYGSVSNLLVGVPVPITVEYFENAGDAVMQLYAKTPSDTNGSIVESQYLTPGGKVLPSGWSLSADADGNLAYERMEVRLNGDVMMYDADGSSHLFAYSGGGGYKPPVNEDATLVRNADNSYKLTDTDGRMYTFNVDGTLRETTTPTDDRHPAALQYNYATQNGIPKLTEIVDGVNTSRKGNLYYAGDSQCASVPSGFDSVPANDLCAFVTTDGQRTDFIYKSGQLVRISLPGNAKYDFGYSTDGKGTLVTIRDVLANDAVAAGTRADDASTLTTIGYDVLARVTSVTAPAPLAGGMRPVHTMEYLANASKHHITGSAEPNGYSQYIEYDDLLRTTKDCDIAALCTLSEWNATKDLALSNTDATGLKTTTIYDDEDRPTDSYGPAPTGYYGTDRKPTSTYVSTVPHTETKYDEGITGTQVAWYNVKDTAGKGVLFGAPKLHTTGILASDPTSLSYNFMTTAAPITPDSGMDGYGLSATGKIRFPQNGTYTIRMWNDDGAKVWINDILMLDDWDTRTVGGTNSTPSMSFVADASKVYRFRFDYMHVGTPGSLALWFSGPGITDISGGQGYGTNHPSFLNPDYSLTTTTKVYDSALGDSATTTNYGTTPELGLAQSTSVDPTGLNLTTSSTYEPAATTGSYLRQTAKFLPGATTTIASTGTQYTYYNATDTADNPCTTGTTEAFKQAGMLKLKAEADPDNNAATTIAGANAPRTTESIYDDAGRVVAARNNADSWTCTTYDARGRATSVAIPSQTIATINALSGSAGSDITRAARTVTSNYAVGGNPLVTSSTDNKGTISSTVDLLGRTVSYTDIYNDTTASTYDSLGRLSARSGPLGAEAFVYDSLNRLTDQKLDTVVYAHLNYDSYSRIDNVTYPTAGQQKITLVRDALGRTGAYTYTLGNGTSTIADSVTRSQSGQITTGTENGVAKTYTYDTAGRLTGATIGTNTYAYGFSAQNSFCGSASNRNANAGKSSNRTSQTLNGVTTYNCYDYADRLLTSTDQRLIGKYDAHGNTVQLGTSTTGTTVTKFDYDSADRNTKITEDTKTTTYERDVQNRIAKRTVVNGTTTINKYGFTGGSDTPDLLLDNGANVVEKYLQLPGGVLLTIRPSATPAANQKVFSLPNIHGDIMATTDATGASTGTYQYDPFGNPIATTPGNTAGASTYGWVGQHEKLTETNYALSPTEMGARVYIPTIGRFMSVDPVEGGGENNYSYPLNPVGDFDLDGNSVWSTVNKVGNAMACQVNVSCQLRQVYSMAGGGISTAFGGSYNKGAGYGATTYDVIGGVTTLGAGGATRAASLAWAPGKAGGRYANMMYHFGAHGSSMGYKSAASYTLGAIKNARSAPVSKVVSSGARAYLGPTKRATFTYGGRLSSYFRPFAKQWNKW